jgi:hypothetical protein
MSRRQTAQSDTDDLLAMIARVECDASHIANRAMETLERRHSREILVLTEEQIEYLDGIRRLVHAMRREAEHGRATTM